MKPLIDILRCPVTRSKLTMVIIKEGEKELDGTGTAVIEEAVLYAEKDWFYPVIKGVPRLNAEAFLEYAGFLRKYVKEYDKQKENILQQYGELVRYVMKKNKRTKESFSKEWKVYDYEKDKTWDADNDAMLKRFLKETDETTASLKGKIIFDAGCGNGKLNLLLAAAGIENVAMDFGSSIVDAYLRNNYAAVHFIQGDVQFPPVVFNYFDIVHSSGVLIHTNNTELSFSCIEPTVKAGGKLSVWIYHHRKDFIHNLFNRIREVTSKLPLSVQYYLYWVTIFPVSFCIKKMKGNKQNAREMMVDILDWFTPEFRWEHGHTEVASWFYKRQYRDIKVTTDEVFGFNTIGEKPTE
jgi:SAM-dependent methyltransferase/uncharacterized protein YbaR (Trm112 family)